jgi:TetR/AcrR family transcriptional repressor of mexCD-oprJ operon
MAEKDDHKLLTALAAALVKKPRSSLQELAAAVGVSKATLYRFSATREQLIERLLNYGISLIGDNITSSGLDKAPPLEALRTLTAKSLEIPEITSFMVNYWELDWEPGITVSSEWDVTLDAFFLRGQQEGIFRIDFPAAALTELWVSILTGLLDAEQRGRIAKVGLLDMMERAFLQGAAR